MGRPRVLILLPLVVSCSLIAVAQNSTTLKLGSPLARTLTAGEVHEFTVKTEENTHVELVVEQRGIDVVVRVTSPTGKSLGAFDTPNGAEGPESVSFVAIAAGDYRIEVAPLEPNKRQSGTYQIKLVDLREASEQELGKRKNQEAAKAKGIALLTELDAAIRQVKSPSARINAQLQISQLLWDTDEKRAAKYLSDAAAGAREYFASLDVTSDDYMERFQLISQFRFQIIQALAQHDPEAAISFFKATAPTESPYGDAQSLATQESTFELAIADQVAAKDPNRALQIARSILKKGYSQSLLTTTTAIAQKDPKLAAEFVNEIASRMLNEEKLVATPEISSLATSLLNNFHQPIHGSGGDEAEQTLAFGPRLSDEKYRQLVQKMFDEVTSYSRSNHLVPHGQGQEGVWNVMVALKNLGPELDKVVTGGSAAVEKKQLEFMGTNSQTIVHPAQQYFTAIAEGPVESSVETITKAPAEFQEQLYLQLARQEANNGNLSQAKQILNEHVSNAFQRRQAVSEIEQQETMRMMTTGKIEDALRYISTLRSSKQRATQLLQLAPRMGSGLTPATALNLLEQARSMLGTSVQAEDQEHMSALLQIARAFSDYDSKRSFEIIEPLVDQLNELCGAAQTLNGFGGTYYLDDELTLHEDNPVAQTATEISSVLGSIAITNFDRAKATADKVRAPQVRLQAYLEIVQQTIQGPRQAQPNYVNPEIMIYRGMNR